ncbi:MAG: tape measure protein [Hydrogenoanaerobacterium sp.]
MARNIGIMITAKDNFSDAITTMRGATRAFDKDMGGMQDKIDALNKTRASLKFDTDDARKELKKAQNEYRKLGTEAKKSEMEAADAKYEQAKSQLRLVAKEARETEKAMISYNSESSKALNKAGGLLGGGIMGELKGLKEGAAMMQWGKMLGDATKDMLNANITSALGSNTGETISTMMGSTISGAAIGSIIPGIGTVIGAGVGAVGGSMMAATNYFSKEDDAFKGIVQERYNTQQERMGKDLTEGSGIAAGREMDKISFSKLMGGRGVAADFLGGIKDMANTTPFQYEDLTKMSKVLSAYKYNPDEIKTLLQQVGDTGAALGMDISGMSAVSTGLGRMKSSGKTTLEYINPLIERGIPAMQYLAEAYGASEKEIYNMISKGTLDGAKSAEIIAGAMGSENEGAMIEQGRTYAGLKSTVEGLEKEMQAAMGEGYNKVRETGLRDQIEYLGGEDGKKLETANKLVGEWQGELKNQKEYQVRAAERAAMEQFEEGRITGAEAGELIAKARADAEAKYMASTGMQTELAAQKSLIKGIREDTSLKDEYWNTGMILGKEFSKGIRSVAVEEMSKALRPFNYLTIDSTYHGIKTPRFKPMVPTEYEAGTGRPLKEPRADVPSYDTVSVPGKAFGMGYVPYNNFPAMLHEGERVMTASENRSYSGSAAPTINITGNTFTVREEADIYEIAKEIAKQVERARELM